MKKQVIINLTQHKSTKDQEAAGVIEPQKKTDIQALLTFVELPTKDEIRKRARQLAETALEEVISVLHDICMKCDDCETVDCPEPISCDKVPEMAIMVGGAPYLMRELEEELQRFGLKVVYAFSRREMKETYQPDGSVKKVMVFRHLGFIEK